MNSATRARAALVALSLLAGLLLGCSELDRLRIRAYLGGADSQLLVGHAYETGEGVPQDLEAAVAWYRRAAEQEHPKAFAQLGKMYALGAGVPRDLVQAHMYFQLGQRRGEAYLGEALAAMEKELTAPEIVRSLQLADSWEAQH